MGGHRALGMKEGWCGGVNGSAFVRGAACVAHSPNCIQDLTKQPSMPQLLTPTPPAFQGVHEPWLNTTRRIVTGSLHSPPSITPPPTPTHPPYPHPHPKGAHEPWLVTKRRIMTDSVRTAADGPLFKGDQREAAVARLERLLLAYALHDAGTGYCQGMADLAAPFVHLYATDAEVGVQFFLGSTTILYAVFRR